MHTTKKNSLALAMSITFLALPVMSEAAPAVGTPGEDIPRQDEQAETALELELELVWELVWE